MYRGAFIFWRYLKNCPFNVKLKMRASTIELWCAPIFQLWVRIIVLRVWGWFSAWPGVAFFHWPDASHSSTAKVRVLPVWALRQEKRHVLPQGPPFHSDNVKQWLLPEEEEETSCSSFFFVNICSVSTRTKCTMHGRRRTSSVSSGSNRGRDGNAG